MMNVNTEKCIGCGLCVKDCFPNDIQMIDGKAKINNVTCMKCGHCIAICPKNAITIDEYNMEEVIEYDKDTFNIEAENLLNFIKFRRSIRKFTKKEVEEEKLAKIIEAGRFTQTATNAQDVGYVVVRGENLEQLKVMTYEAIKGLGEYMLANTDKIDPKFVKYANLWVRMYDAYKLDPEKNDKLFFNAPAIIVVTANIDVNGGLASSNMELMTNALGLGTFFSGFFVRASENSKEIKEFIELEEGRKIISCMVVGYPGVKYSRTVPRKDAVVLWK